MKKFYLTLPVYEKELWKAIDPKVRELVFTFIDKGYITVSSCEGHDILQSRLVTILFPTKEKAEEFSQLILSYKIPWFGCRIIKDIDFFNLEDDYNNPKRVPRADLTQWLAKLLGEYSPEYYVAEIYIGEIIPEDMAIWKEYIVKCFKRVTWDMFTKWAVLKLKSKLKYYHELIY